MKRFLLNALISGFILTAPAFATELAKVDDTVITTEAFLSSIKSLGSQGSMVASNPELRKRFLDHMINSQLVARKAKAEGFEKDPKFQTRLAEMTQQLLAGEYMDHLIEKKATDQNLKAWFEANKAQFSNKEIHAHHILCADEATAKKALEEVNKTPADFDKIAKKYSKDKTVDLGFFGHGRMVPEFDVVAFNTKKGAISQTIAQTTFGWHVIKVTDIRGGEDVKYESVKKDVEHKFRQSTQEDLVRELREKSKIAINDQALKDVKIP
ncbi:MAG: peptidyl-prolyl cis-trans isomerase [Pseudomonadota bacterium]